VVRGPVYKPIWISVGIDVTAGYSIAEVVENVKDRLRAFLAPVGPAGYRSQTTPLFMPPADDAARGWPLRKAVASRVLLAEAATPQDFFSAPKSDRAKDFLSKILSH
jgi:hypothetical protein